MTAERWAQMKQLYNLAQEQLPGEREVFVEAGAVVGCHGSCKCKRREPGGIRAF